MARYYRRKQTHQQNEEPVSAQKEYEEMIGHGEMEYINELEHERASRTLPYMQTLRWRTCRKKRRSHPEAVVESYNRRVVFGTLNNYLCSRHKAWHVGHSSKRLASALVIARHYGLE